MAISEQYRPEQTVQNGKGYHRELTTDLEQGLVARCEAILAERKIIKPGDRLELLPPGHKDRAHDGSQAQYFVDSDIGPHWVLVSHLPKHSKTSGEHFHPGGEEDHPHRTFETYTCLEGELSLILDGREQKIKAGETFKVWYGVGHRVETNGSSASLLIVGENLALYPREKRHIRRK